MRQTTAARSGMLLQSGDPKPLCILNGESGSDVLLVCEHAGNAIPKALAELGLPADQLERHIAYDIGAYEVARRLAEELSAPLVIQPYSRLVIDCNRPIESPEAIPRVSDGVAIPGNLTVSAAERQCRVNEIFEPYQAAVSDALDRHPRRAAFAIHSFNPVLGGSWRRWDLAFLFRKDRPTSDRLAAAVGRAEPDLVIGMNEPYAIDEETDWFVPHHCEQRALRHSLIEIRNDHLNSAAACQRWADLLARSIRRTMSES